MMDRRDVLRGASVTGIATLTAATPGIANASDLSASPGFDPTASDWTEPELEDRERVLTIGFNDGEADCWLHTIRAAAAFFALEELHPSDVPEVTQAVHLIQQKLLSRPAYREYLELAGEDPQ